MRNLVHSFRNEERAGEMPDAILASNHLPGFYPAVYRRNFSPGG